jgi:hypothetical protein
VSFLIVGGQIHEHANPFHPLRLLRARRARPRHRAAEKRDELASSHVEHGASSHASGLRGQQ